jgi:2-iminobutanoate/2-iminopropanoate deaminase
MDIRTVEVPGHPVPHSPYSHAIVANGFVFVSGQIPVRPGGPTEIVGGTMQEQTRQWRQTSRPSWKRKRRH